MRSGGREAAASAPRTVPVGHAHPGMRARKAHRGRARRVARPPHLPRAFPRASGVPRRAHHGSTRPGRVLLHIRRPRPRGGRRVLRRHRQGPLPRDGASRRHHPPGGHHTAERKALPARPRPRPSRAMRLRPRPFRSTCLQASSFGEGHEQHVWKRNTARGPRRAPQRLLQP